MGRIEAEPVQGALEDQGGGQRAERRLLRRLPDHRIAADQRQGRVPGPGCDGKVKAGVSARRVGAGLGISEGPARRDRRGRRLRENPTAKSQMSIISCTSPQPSCSGSCRPPASRARPRPPSRRAIPRREAGPVRPALGPGTSRQARKAAVGALDDRRHVGCRRLSDPRDLGPVDRRADGSASLPDQRRRCQTQALENILAGHGGGLIRCEFAWLVARAGTARRVSTTSLRPQIRPPGKPGGLRVRSVSLRRMLSGFIKINSRDCGRFRWATSHRVGPVRRCDGAGSSDYIRQRRAGVSRALRSQAMARSTNILLACVAMLGAMLLAVAIDAAQPDGAHPRGVQYRAASADHSSATGSRSRGSTSSRRRPPDSLEATIYNQEASRGFVDPEGHVVMLMVAYGESQSDRLQLHHPEVCYTAQGFRVSRTSPLKLDYSLQGSRRSRRRGSSLSARSGLSPSPTGCGSAMTIRAAIGPARRSSSAMA